MSHRNHACSTGDLLINPYTPPPAVSENVLIREGQVRNRWLIRLCSLQVVVIVVALGFNAHQHRSIVGSGPIFSLVGLAIAYVAYRSHALLEMVIGLSAPLLSLLICILINYYQWSPSQGERPNTLIMTAYALVAVPALLFAIVRQIMGNRSDAGVYNNPLGADKHAS